jgi:hypothetical protein
MEYTFEQTQIFSEFIYHCFEIMQKKDWLDEKRADYQRSNEKNGNVMEFIMPRVEPMGFYDVVETFGRGDINFVLKIWFTFNIFKDKLDDKWFDHWINVHHPTCGLTNDHLRTYYDSLGMDGLKNILGLNEISLK